MERNLRRLAGNEYDLLVIGGGVYGLCVAWDAALRGLSVALLEKGDFGAATSSATLKIIHGGLRYLQHADVRRMRESIYERMVMMRLAPHLVHPMPCLVPTYGHLLRGKEVMAVAMMMTDLISFDRNRLDDPQKRIPRGRVISRQKCLGILPGINPDGLTGGAVYHDAQMHNPDRLTLSFALSATEAGANLANYVEVTGLAARNGRVEAVTAKDLRTDETFDVRGRVVANMTGPWSDIVIASLHGAKPDRRVLRSKGIQIVTPLYCADHAFAVESTQRDPDAIVSRGGRLFFITPWRGRSLIGTTDTVYEGDPDDFAITAQDVAEFVEEINASYPGAKLTPDQVPFWFGGLRPVGEKNIDPNVSKAARKFEIVDHARRDGVANFISVTGVKYTTARGIAQQTVDIVFRKMDRRPPKCPTGTARLWGGEIERFDDFMAEQVGGRPDGLSEATMGHLVYTYGSRLDDILAYIEADPALGASLPGSDVTRAEIVHACRHEMVGSLADMVLRRTELGTLGAPAPAAVDEVLAIAAKELGWSASRQASERDALAALYTLRK
ncbi:MAG: glycerol-3-phosphate dehydrogenase/oxidase [Verrucomicrobia bacterium]|nr:glycerol-3-phosphate dehydrogenase/oxidase [Verrucomicrobiota bacterium]